MAGMPPMVVRAVLALDNELATRRWSLRSGRRRPGVPLVGGNFSNNYGAFGRTIRKGHMGWIEPGQGKDRVVKRHLTRVLAGLCLTVIAGCYRKASEDGGLSSPFRRSVTTNSLRWTQLRAENRLKRKAGIHFHCAKPTGNGLAGCLRDTNPHRLSIRPATQLQPCPPPGT